MKVKVIKRFRDKYTGKIHEVSKDGEFIEVAEERFKEILEAGEYVEAIDEKPVEAIDEKPAKPKKESTKKSTEEDK